MDYIKEVYKRLFLEYKDFSSLDECSTKYIFETWKMVKEMYEEHQQSKKDKSIKSEDKERDRFMVIDVTELTPNELDHMLNNLIDQGYTRAFQSDIQWYKGRGQSGVIVFELKEEQ